MTLSRATLSNGASRSRRSPRRRGRWQRHEPSRARKRDEPGRRGGKAPGVRTRGAERREQPCRSHDVSPCNTLAASRQRRGHPPRVTSPPRHAAPRCRPERTEPMPPHPRFATRASTAVVRQTARRANSHRPASTPGDAVVGRLGGRISATVRVFFFPSRPRRSGHDLKSELAIVRERLCRRAAASRSR